MACGRVVTGRWAAMPITAAHDRRQFRRHRRRRCLHRLRIPAHRRPTCIRPRQKGRLNCLLRRLAVHRYRLGHHRHRPARSIRRRPLRRPRRCPHRRPHRHPQRRTRCRPRLRLGRCLCQHLRGQRARRQLPPQRMLLCPPVDSSSAVSASEISTLRSCAARSPTIALAASEPTSAARPASTAAARTGYGTRRHAA